MKYITYLFAVLLAFTSCVSADFDEDFNAVNDEVQRLHNEDDTTRAIILRSIMAKRIDLINQLDQASEIIGEKLTTKVTEINTKIDTEMAGFRKLVNSHSNVLGNEISLWDDKIRTLCDQRQKELETRRKDMEKQLKEAILTGDVNLQKQVENQIKKIDAVSEILPAVVQHATRRFNLLATIESRLAEIKTINTDLLLRRDKLTKLVDNSRDNMKAFTEEYTEEYKANQLAELNGLIQQLSEEYNEIVNKFGDYLTICEDMHSNMPDLDNLTNEAEGFVTSFEDILSKIEDFDNGPMEDLMDEIESLKNDIENDSQADDVLQQCEEAVEAIEETKENLSDINDHLTDFSNLEDVKDFVEDMMGYFN